MKFIQIAICDNGDGEEWVRTLVALADDGSVWQWAGPKGARSSLIRSGDGSGWCEVGGARIMRETPVEGMAERIDEESEEP